MKSHFNVLVDTNISSPARAARSSFASDSGQSAVRCLPLAGAASPLDPASVLLVADGRCPQIRQLLAKADAPVLWLCGTNHPFDVISQELARRRAMGQPVDALHWISHGSPGQLHVGDHTINSQSLIDRQQQLSNWNLDDLLLWSCSTAADQTFISLLEEFTGATVWASSTAINREQPSVHNRNDQKRHLADLVGQHSIARWTGSLEEITQDNANSYINNNIATIPDNITSIGSEAFERANLTAVIFNGNNVTSIGSFAFNNNSLSSINIPDSVTSIGSYAFDSNSLTSVTISDSRASIENYVGPPEKVSSREE